MTNDRITVRQLELVARIVEEGHKLLKVHKNEKKPIALDWPHKHEDQKEIIDHIKSGGNIGWQHGLGTIAIDCDSRQAAETVYRTYGPFKSIVRTRRGIHFFCAYSGDTIGNHVNVHGLFDIRGRHGFTVCPPSVISDFQYSFVEGYDEIRSSQMTAFRQEWLPVTKTKPAVAFEKSGDMVLRAVLWTNAIPGELDGNRDNKCFYVACKLIRSFELSIEEAWPILLSFNARCKPPIRNIKQLRRKLFEAQKGK